MKRGKRTNDDRKRKRYMEKALVIKCINGWQTNKLTAKCCNKTTAFALYFSFQPIDNLIYIFAPKAWSPIKKLKMKKFQELPPFIHNSH